MNFIKLVIVFFSFFLLFSNNSNAQNGAYESIRLDGGSLNIFKPTTNGGWSRGANFYDLNSVKKGGFGFAGAGNSYETLYFAVGSSPQNSGKGLYVHNPTGKVTIGTKILPQTYSGEDVSGYSLYVADGIFTEELKVMSGWADYVFDVNYKLMPLKEVENYIDNNHRLPNSISTEEVMKNGGINVGETTVYQQEKIEELFLYVIELNKELEQLKEENKQLREAVETIQTEE